MISAISMHTFAQKIKYKEVYEYIKKKDYEGALPYLKIVLKADSLQPSANLYLGVICYTRAKNMDVLKQNPAVLRFADSAGFYLARARRMINEKEIRKNDEFYTIYAKSKKDTSKFINDRDTILARVLYDIDYKSAEIKKHKLNAQKIFNRFSKGVTFYNQSAFAYRDLNNRFITEKQMLLLSDDAVVKSLKDIATNFDSATYHLAEYLKAIKEYPIKDYSQNIKPQNIETYRLDGLNIPDFLAKEVTVWNYSQWAKTNLELLEKDVKRVREMLIKYENKYNRYFDQIQNRTLNEDSVRSFLPDKKILMITNKYDFGALPVKMLAYKAAKLAFLVTTLDKYNTTDSLNPHTIEPRAMLFTDLNRKIKLCDTALMEIAKINVAEEAKKHPEYISKVYTNVSNLQTYINNEQQFVTFFKNQYSDTYIKILYMYLQKWYDSTSYIVYNSAELPLSVTRNSTKSGYKTTAVREDRYGNIYVCGYNGTAESATSFVCKINAYRQIIWFKNIPNRLESKAGFTTEFPTAIEVVGDGCVLSVNYKLGTTIKNLLVRYDKVGNEILAKRYDLGKITRKIVYDEIGDNYIMALKGTELIDYTETDEQVNVACVNNQGGATWIQQIYLTGNIADFIKVFEGYMLVCNYAKVGAGGTSQIASRAGTTIAKSNIFMMKFTGQGKIGPYETIPSYTPIYAIGAVKVSSGNINIVGYSDDMTPDYLFKKYTEREKQMQKVVNSNMEFVY
ncbi:MAG: hypothetical protein NW207_00975 [Cytophagales bacterium]|nr:hypothetical protein [Cytophagales bacterium]